VGNDFYPTQPGYGLMQPVSQTTSSKTLTATAGGGGQVRIFNRLGINRLLGMGHPSVQPEFMPLACLYIGAYRGCIRCPILGTDLLPLPAVGKDAGWGQGWWGARFSL